jgi:Fe-S-cluster containining protein
MGKIKGIRKTGKCIRCGECCEDKIFLDISFLSEYRQNFQRKIVKALHSEQMEQLAIITEDGKCVFLRADNSCAIYPNRPDICRMFGIPGFLECPKVDSHGQLRSEEGSQEVHSRNCDHSKHSKRYENWLNKETKRRAHEYIAKHGVKDNNIGLTQKRDQTGRSK